MDKIAKRFWIHSTNTESFKPLKPGNQNRKDVNICTWLDRVL